MGAIPGSLEALAEGLIDYAGLYPPASLSLDAVLENYDSYRASRDAWILNRLVLPVSSLAEARPRPGWRITLLVEDESGVLPPEVETLETRQVRRFSLPTYCEAPLERIEGAFAKVRTGGVTPDAIPAPAAIAEFLTAAAARRIAFKATAGLHRAIRSVRPLTYAPDAPRAPMHGFVNVFVAAAFVWHGAGREVALDILNEEEPRAFGFSGDAMSWRSRRLPTEAIRSARQEFAHSFGSCSFEEPVADLRALGWLS